MFRIVEDAILITIAVLTVAAVIFELLYVVENGVVGLADLLIIHNWLNYAKLIKDESYKDITNEIFFSEYIFQAVKKRNNQN